MTKYYNRANACDRCGDKLFPHNARREFNEECNWTGKWLCNKCWYNTDYKKRSDSTNNLMKLVSDRRTGNQNPNSPNAKGDLFEILTEIRKDVRNLNKDNDNYHEPIDHSSDSYGKIPQTRGRLYDSYKQVWSFASFERDWHKEFHYVILYCVSEDGQVIERMYEIPKENLNPNGITITKHQLRKNSNTLYWYEKFRITDEKDIKRTNEIWKKLIG